MNHRRGELEIRARWVMAVMGIAAGSVGCTALLGLDDKTYGDAGGGSGAATTGTGGTGGGAAGAGGGGGSGGGTGGGAPMPGDTIWARSSTGSLPLSVPTIGGVAVDGAHRIWVTGAFQGALQLEGCAPLAALGAPPNDQAFFVARFGPDGACEDAVPYDGASNVVPGGIAIDSRGNVVAVGTFNPSLNVPQYPLTSGGGQDIFVVQLAADGTPSWAQRFGGTTKDTGRAVAIAPGGIVVGGGYSGAVTIGMDSMTSVGMSDILLFKLNAVGAPVWARGFGSPMNDSISGVAISPGGDIGITGTVGGPISLLGIPSQTISGNVFAAVLNPVTLETMFAAANTLVGGLSDGYTALFDDLGNLFAGGSFSGPLDLSGGMLSANANYLDGFVARFGGQTRIQALGQEPGSGANNEILALAIASGSQGALVFAGTCQAGGHYLGTPCSTDGQAAKIAVGSVPQDLLSNGAYWLRSFGDSDDNHADAVAIDHDRGEVIVVGRIAGTIELEPGLPIDAGSGEIFILKLKL
jgi:hypothetical protein